MKTLLNFFITISLLSLILSPGITVNSLTQPLTGTSFHNGEIIKKHESAPGNAAAVLPASLNRVKPARRISALVPIVDQPTIKNDHKMLFNGALMSLPEEYRRQLKTFRVIYENPTSRGLAGKTVMILSGQTNSAKELRGLFYHEFGHLIDTGYYQGSEESGYSGFTDGDEVIYRDDISVGFYSISWQNSSSKQSDSKTEDFITGYAATDPFEDFAESAAMYLLQPEYFKYRAGLNPVIARKLDFIETYIFPGLPQIASGNYNDDIIPWDSTKLDYEWKGIKNATVVSIE